ncbi:alpha/beta hydrolase [Pseudomonas sp. FP597]|uniref:alpha/beta fold hydrolase n=1 Tax=Pseudomonas sp. FP597 TaxID=2954096 RepID=UPI0001E97214|nr:alpha/beta hydrolase [Pseudomonas sp. FP597]EFQ62905.1 alpha/beta hydrolase fold protein [Pseudomonas fluorescens WH6]WLI09005.1 alpha/beta hydrolase [Pseudomonas sp. FP597]
MRALDTHSRSGSPASFALAENQSITVGGVAFAYRDLGPRVGVPLMVLNHWGAVLDNFDPRIIDGLADTRRVIALDYRGIGGSGGTAPLTVAEMADDVIGLMRALGVEQVDLLGFSLGGFVAQDIAMQAPGRVRRLILTGTGPAGGTGIANVGKVSWPLMIKGLLTLRDPKFYLFFTSTANGRRAASAFLKRLKERRKGRVKGPTPRAFARQLKAITAWGRQAPQDLSGLQMPTLVANGDHDIMVPTANSIELARRIPGAQLILYKDAGHGGIFQYYAEFVAQARAFLDA